MRNYRIAETKGAIKMAVKPEGIDVSNHQPGIKWAQVKDAGISFAFLKCSEGTGYVDPQFKRYWAACKQAGIIRAAYHFFRWDFDPGEQARHFLATVGKLGAGDLPLAVDIERPGDGTGTRNYGVAESERRVRVFVNIVKAATGKPVILYTYPYAWREVMGNSKAFADCLLWVASYPNVPGPLGGWTKHTIHQYTSTGRVAGIGQIVDRNTFNGTLADLRILAGLTEPPPQPPASPDILDFPGITPFNLQHGFKDLWLETGNGDRSKSVERCGYPISPEYALTVDGIALTVQDCENVQFEYQPGQEPRIGAANRRYQQLLKAQPALAEEGGQNG
jgi:lysozyme